jgi:serine/threonine protein kinase
MININERVAKYLDSGVAKVVKESIINFKDAIIDDFNDQGCNGYVFFGEHKVFRKRVAVKYYYFGEDTHEEVMLLKNVKHDNILSIWDASVVGDGWAYFITDEICHGTIDDYLSGNNISLSESLQITKGILLGLSELHKEENQLLHRDIKPANILMGDNSNPIIADFGSIKRVEAGSTFVNASRYSPLYRPPESIDKGIHNIQSDIYQVGLVMFQIFGGVVSYDFKDYMNQKELKHYNNLIDDYEKSKYIDSILEKKICGGKLVNLELLPVYVDNRVRKIIKNATHIKLEKRYLNTSEFFLDLHKLGTIPDWKEVDNNNYECNYKNSKYRVRKIPKGYAFEKNNNSNTWRKVTGIDYSSSKKELFAKIADKLKNA